MTTEFTDAVRRIGGIVKRSQAGKKLSASDQAFCARVAEANAGGRPRTSPEKLPIYDSMQQAAAMTQIPIAALKQAKRAGCEAFRWNRVDLSQLLPWVFQHEKKEVENWAEEYDKWHAKREKTRHDRENDLVIDKDVVERGVHEAERQFFGVLDQEKGKLPPLCVDRTAPEIAKLMQSAFDRAKDKLKESLTSIGA